jgi:hypothetical protein
VCRLPVRLYPTDNDVHSEKPNDGKLVCRPTVGHVMGEEEASVTDVDRRSNFTVTGYWLLLRGGIIQCPMHCDLYLIYCGFLSEL